MKRLITGIAAAILLFVGAATAAAQSETIEYYGLDALGSVRVIFDQQGNVLDRMDYDPFGANLRAAIKFPTEQFAQLARDGESGQDYAEIRQYNVFSGRFNRVDPVYSGLFQPQKWNRYSYTLNNPATLNDPSGADPVSALSGLAALCGVVCPQRPGNGQLGSSSNPIRSTSGGVEDTFIALGTEPPNGSWVGNEGWLDTLQSGLDAISIGLDLTGVGVAVSPVVDLANAGVSLARGDTMGAGLSVVAAVPVLGSAANAARMGRRTVIGRVKDLQNLGPGEQSLLPRLPNLGDPKLNWKQNAGVLREEMHRGLPIRDASIGDTGGQFLNAERNLLLNHGWRLDPVTGYWMPPLTVGR